MRSFAWRIVSAHRSCCCVSADGGAVDGPRSRLGGCCRYALPGVFMLSSLLLWGLMGYFSTKNTIFPKYDPVLTVLYIVCALCHFYANWFAIRLAHDRTTGLRHYFIDNAAGIMHVRARTDATLKKWFRRVCCSAVVLNMLLLSTSVPFAMQLPEADLVWRYNGVVHTITLPLLMLLLSPAHFLLFGLVDARVPYRPRVQ